MNLSLEEQSTVLVMDLSIFSFFICLTKTLNRFSLFEILPWQIPDRSEKNLHSYTSAVPFEKRKDHSSRAQSVPPF